VKSSYNPIHALAVGNANHVNPAACFASFPEAICFFHSVCGATASWTLITFSTRNKNYPDSWKPSMYYLLKKKKLHAQNDINCTNPRSDSKLQCPKTSQNLRDVTIRLMHESGYVV